MDRNIVTYAPANDDTSLLDDSRINASAVPKASPPISETASNASESTMPWARNGSASGMTLQSSARLTVCPPPDPGSPSRAQWFPYPGWPLAR